MSFRLVRLWFLSLMTFRSMVVLACFCMNTHPVTAQIEIVKPKPKPAPPSKPVTKKKPRITRPVPKTKSRPPKSKTKSVGLPANAVASTNPISQKIPETVIDSPSSGAAHVSRRPRKPKAETLPLETGSVISAGSKVSPEPKAAAGFITLPMPQFKSILPIELSPPINQARTPDGIATSAETTKTQEPINNISLGIVIDRSGSSRTKLPFYIDFAKKIIEKFEAGDEGFTAVFHSEPELVQGFTTDSRELYDSLGEIFATGGTAYLDAIIATTDYAEETAKNKRRGVIVISDLQVNAGNSNVKINHIISAINESSVTVFLVGILDKIPPQSLSDQEELEKGKMLVRQLAAKTNCRYYFLVEGAGSSGIVARIFEEMKK